MPGNIFYRIGIAIAAFVSVLTVWMRIVGSEENPANLGYFGVVFTAIACAFTARFQASEMARAMVATAGVQALIGLAVATAPVTAREPMGVSGAVLQAGMFVTLWLVAAAFFHRSAGVDARGALA